MCLIIDINVGQRVLFDDSDPDFSEVHRRLFSPGRRSLKVVYGGKLLDEYRKSHSLLRRILILDQAGRAERVDDDIVNSETDRLIDENACISDDPHIVALARCSKARVLCSQDRNLHTDFTNAGLIAQPRGKVFQKSNHVHLLNDPCP